MAPPIPALDGIKASHAAVSRERMLAMMAEDEGATVLDYTYDEKPIPSDAEIPYAAYARLGRAIFADSQARRANETDEALRARLIASNATYRRFAEFAPRVFDNLTRRDLPPADYALILKMLALRSDVLAGRAHKDVATSQVQKQILEVVEQNKHLAPKYVPEAGDQKIL